MKNNFNNQSGQVILGAVLFSAIISVLVATGVVGPSVISSNNARRIINSKESFFLAEAGIEDVTRRLKESYEVTSPSTISLNGNEAITTITDISANEKQLSSSGDVLASFRKSRATLTTTAGASFNFGVQTGQGGFSMANSATINGNLYSNGSIVGANTSIVNGDVVSAGPTGLISGMEITGSAYANTITNSQIGGDAYYQTISGSSVVGDSFPGSEDQDIIPLPIDDEKVEEWKTIAGNGTIINSPCPYVIDTNVTLGPAKINCDLTISGNDTTLNLTGHIWVVGNVITQNSPKIKVDSSIGGKVLSIIADNPANRTTSSRIDMGNSTTFEGSGTEGSYVMMLSQNNSGELGGSTSAVSLGQSVAGDLILYAGHGIIDIANSGILKQFTAYKVIMGQSSTIDYELGLASLLFESGPGGTWKISGWREGE